MTLFCKSVDRPIICVLVSSQADVIVNTAGPSRDLMFGELSKALSYKAGPKMQTELYDSRGTGNVVITKGYNLQCKEVYHTFCAENKQGTATTVQYSIIHTNSDIMHCY